MGWKAVNLEEVLKSEKRKSERQSADEVVDAFRRLLKQDDEIDEGILDNIFGGNDSFAHLDPHKLKPDRIFHLDHIRKLCTDYRLRFLDGRYFKGNIPYEAIGRIKKIQRNQEVEIEHFKILAPAPMFNLELRDKDPLLFVPLSDERFYLVHKWGRDLHPLRRLLVFPFRNFKSLLGTVAVFAFLVVMCVPDSVMTGPYDDSTAAIRVIFFFYLFIAFSGLTALYGFSRLKNFNSNLWNSKYFD